MATQSQTVINEEAGPKVYNKVDDPSVPSMTSIGVYEENADQLPIGAPAVEGEVPEPVVDEPKPADTKPVEPPPVEKNAMEKAEDDVAKAKADADKTPPKPPVDKHKEDEDRRFAAITKARRIAERERDMATERIRQLEEENEKLRKSVPLPGEPQIEDFDSDKEYMKALAKWTFDTEQRALREQEEKKETVTTEKQVFAELDEEIDNAMTKGREKYTDFNDAVLGNTELHITPVMVEATLLSDIAEDIFYYFGTHPDEAEKIAGMNPLKIAREIVRIEKELVKTAEAAPPINESSDGKEPVVTPPVEKKVVSSAPEPITPPRSEGLVDKDPAKMTPREYRAWRESKS